MSIQPGDRIGPYEVIDQLGAGGMGEVWRARDQRLGRDVAIKVLPAVFVADPDRLARFEREAKLLASLNHPNIAQLHGIEEDASGGRALVMELVEGATLDERIAAGPLSVEDSLAIAGELAAALSEAHDKGIVHRDLKPQNVKITPAGTVKVLDFGLAKGLESAVHSGSAPPAAFANSPTLMNSPTLVGGATELGIILGTAAYMSPEQARGKPVDKRADIWAFGCVLFEMLAGQKLFGGETASDTLAAVLRQEVSWERLPAATPPTVKQVLRRCLERDPRQRLRDIGDAWLLLREPASEAVSAAPAQAKQRAASWLAIGALAGIAVGVAAGWALLRRAPAETHPRRPAVLAIRMPEGVATSVDTNTGQAQLIAISPDGSKVAFVGHENGQQRIYLRSLDRNEVTPVTGSEGAASPFFSPDGKWLAFFGRGRLMKAAIGGGEPIELCETGLDRGGVWAPDGSIVLSPGPATPLMRIAASGGSLVPFSNLDTAQGERSHRWPALLPGGKEVAFTVGTTAKPGDYEDAAIDAVEIATGKRRRLLQGASMVRFAESGHVLIGREGEVQAIPLAAAGGGIPDDPAQVLFDVGGDPASGVVYFDIARDGTLVYAERDPKVKEQTLAWIDRAGKVTPIPVPPQEYRIPRISPDGRKIAVGIGRGRGGASDIWIVDIATATLQRLTFDGKSANPLWSRDGQSVTYSTNSPTTGAFAEKRADGSAEPRILAELDPNHARGPLSWAPDGSLLYSEDSGPGFGNDILMLAPGDPKPRPVVQTADVEIGGALSPDGRFIAYSANTSGAAAYYVQSFPGPGGRWQVTQGTNGTLRWSPKGDALYVRTNEGLIEFPVESVQPFTLGRPRSLFNLSFTSAEDVFTNFDVAGDGRFLAVLPSSGAPVADRLVVALDWFTQLEEKVRAPGTKR